MASSRCDSDHDIGRPRVYFEDRLQIEKRVELTGIPDDALACGCAEKGDQYPLQVVPLRKRLEQRIREVCPVLLICAKIGDSLIFRRM